MTKPKIEPIEPTQEEQTMIIEEVKDHCRWWNNSDRTKRDTVVSHLEAPSRACHPGRKPMENAAQKVEWMIQNQKLQNDKSGRTEFLLCPKQQPTNSKSETE